MEQKYYKCPGCSSSLEVMQIKTHIPLCGSYPNVILRQIKNLRKDTPQNQLQFVLAECELVSERVRELLKKPSYNFYGEKNYDDDIIQCARCFNKIIDICQVRCMDKCPHFLCIQCLRDHIEHKFVLGNGILNCPSKGCEATIGVSTIKEAIGERSYEELTKKNAQKVFDQYQSVFCQKCKEVFAFVQGEAKDAPKKDCNGKQIKPQYALHYAQFRFSCRECRTDQCKQCKSIPYHFGKTCAQHKAYSSKKKCRYCMDLMDEVVSKQPALFDVCAKKQCQELSTGACLKVKACEHPCFGYRNQKKCLPCLAEGCAKKNSEMKNNDIDEGQFCNICHVEGLGAAPCIQIKCRHVFHVHCLLKSLKTRWVTPRIFFNFLQCPLCKADIEVSQDSCLFELVQRNLSLREKIKEMAAKRIKFEELQKKDPKLQPGGSYHGKVLDYAVAIYAYFQCFKCKNPYFGGRRDCEAAMINPKDKAEFDFTELICPNCCPVPIQSCQKHDRDFIEFKCRFCCQIATWFCWGNTHFCEDCHKKQCAGTYLNKLPKESLQKCEGPKKCPVGGNHDGNGDQRSLGCSICRNYRDNAKDY